MVGFMAVSGDELRVVVVVVVAGLSAWESDCDGIADMVVLQEGDGDGGGGWRGWMVISIRDEAVLDAAVTSSMELASAAPPRLGRARNRPRHKTRRGARRGDAFPP